MSKFSLFVSFAVVAACMTSLSFAQGPGGPGGRGGPGGGRGAAMRAKMEADLKLTPKQKAEFEKISDEARGKMRAAFGGKRPANPGDMMAKMEPIRKERDKKLAKVLTAAQFKQYKAMEAAQMARFTSGRGGPGGRPGPGGPGH